MNDKPSIIRIEMMFVICGMLTDIDAAIVLCLFSTYQQKRWIVTYSRNKDSEIVVFYAFSNEICDQMKYLIYMQMKDIFAFVFETF